MLKSSINTLEIKKQVEELAEDLYCMGRITEDYDCFYEHNQWFIYDLNNEDTFAVVDASPGINYGLDIEKI